jgi:hypothetical protein
VYLYTGANTQVTAGLNLAAIRALDDDVADVLSMSYGLCEQGLGQSGNVFFQDLWAQAAAQGQSVFVSTGDSGSAGCDVLAPTEHGLAVNGLASTPYNVAVGGTDVYYSDYNNSSALPAQVASYWNLTGTNSPATSLLQPVPEQPWNDAFGLNTTGVDDYTASAGSGGASSCVQGTDNSSGQYSSCTAGYPKPSWQTGTGVPNDGVRDIPDVSLFAANGANYSFWPICTLASDCVTTDSSGTVNITGVGGTSASAPLMAGIMALLDQYHNGRQGNPNFVLYPLAAKVPSVFHDITVGNNNVPCVEATPDCTLDANGDGYYTLQDYSATAGYDLASGLGSVDAYQLITNWSKITFNPTKTSLALSSTTFKHGTSVTITFTVTSGSGTPTGNVALASTSALPGQTGLGTIALTNGTGQMTTKSLPGGTYSLVAQYGGDGVNAGSTSSPVNVTVTPEKSTVVMGGIYYGVDSNGNSAPITSPLTTQYGTYFYFDVQVYGSSSSASNPDGAATGKITLTDNGKKFTTMDLNSDGIAELPTSTLAPGTHELVASYSGDSSFKEAKSSTLTITITKGVAQIYISSADEVGYYNWPYLFTPESATYSVPVLVSSAQGRLPVGGTVTVTYGSQSQTLQLVDNGFMGAPAIGAATAVFTNETAGTFAVNASYSGDDNLEPVSPGTNPLQVTVYATTLPASTTTLTVSPTTITSDTPVTVNVKVTGGSQTPSGYYSLYENGILTLFGLDYSLDSTGSASFTFQPPFQLIGTGTIQFMAVYSGDHYHTPSASNVATATADIGDFAFTTANPIVAIPSGGSGKAIISVSPTGYLYWTVAGKVSFTCATSSPDLSCFVSPKQVTLPANISQVANTTMRIEAANAKPGTYTATVTAASNGVTHALQFKVVVQ